MRRIALLATLAPLALLSLALVRPQADEQETAAVRKTVLDYVEAFYEGDQQRIERAVHTDVVRLGFFRPAEGGDYREARLDFEGLVELAKSLNQSGWIPPDAAKEVEVFEVLDRTATARCTASWGVDFLHLVRGEEGWKIVQVLWQSHPVPPARSAHEGQ